MKQRLVIYVSLIICIASFLSFRWPVNAGKITSTFGESRADHFHDGTDLISGDKRVFPPADGKLLYCWNKALFPFDNYTGSGNFKVIAHDSKMASVFLHLEDSESVVESYGENDPVAVFGNTGRSFGAHLHFTFVDMAKVESINPFPFFPEYKDTKPPVIGPYAIHTSEKYIQMRNNSKVRLTQNWPLLVKIYDEASGGEHLGIYKLQVVFNNEQIANLTFDRITGSKNGLTISGKNFENIYDPGGYYKIEVPKYISGINVFSITATDFSGNQKTDNFSIDVTLDR
ncbi:MAG TPA: M23 family metallopeptidase [Spirochaetota bacterium]